MSTYSPRSFDSIPRNVTRSRSPKLIIETACSGRIDLLPDHRWNQGGHRIVVGLTLRFTGKEGCPLLIRRRRNRGRWAGVRRQNSSPTPPAASAQPPEIEREPPGNRVGSATHRIPRPLSPPPGFWFAADCRAPVSQVGIVIAVVVLLGQIEEGDKTGGGGFQSKKEKKRERVYLYF
ncbi:unnamed protein product [Cuscuta campestris]|uniref:Uncharacterized protein n=1 Tax=Cuscuta campestris TaxID=132261 RepID=A0A484LTM2_9ASTE|nr:unnamed protein product [Cuscuta campestris]